MWNLALLKLKVLLLYHKCFYTCNFLAVAQRHSWEELVISLLYQTYDIMDSLFTFGAFAPR